MSAKESAEGHIHTTTPTLVVELASEQISDLAADLILNLDFEVVEDSWIIEGNTLYIPVPDDISISEDICESIKDWLDEREIDYHDVWIAWDGISY